MNDNDAASDIQWRNEKEWVIIINCNCVLNLEIRSLILNVIVIWDTVNAEADIFYSDRL